VSVILPMRSSAGTLLEAKNWAGSRPLSRFTVPLRPEAFESAGPMLAEFSAVWAYTVCGVFERRGVKAGPQATAITARSGLYAS